MNRQKQMTGYPSIDKPWLKYYSDDVINAPLPECTIYEYLMNGNWEHPSDIAINYLGRKISYRALFENIDRTAAAFLKAGVKPQEIVTVALPSIPEALYCVFALNKIGAVANMVHPLPGTEEMIFYLNEVQSRVAVIFDGAYADIADEIHRTSVQKAVVVSVADSLSLPLKVAYTMKAGSAKISGTVFQGWKDFIREGKETEVVAVKKDCHEMAIISHTGGTTGEPKGVMCSDQQVNTLIYQAFCNFEYEERGTCLAVLPPFVNYSLINSMLEMLYIGFTVVLIPKYEPEQLGKYIKKYHPHAVLSIPSYWEALLRIDGITSVDMSCLRYIFYGGEAMSIENENAINAVLKKCGAGGQLCKGLGSTEMMSVASQTYEDCNEHGSAGVPLVWVNCKIVEPDTTNELPYDQEGEICFCGPTLMMGYYNKPEDTDNVVKIHSDGNRWFHTGDIGYITENGVIFVTGRIKRIIMTKGSDGQVTKMFPDRIEKAVCANPMVELCCVVGKPDKERINYPVAYIVLKAGEKTSDETKKKILETCKTLLPEYMLPEEILFREMI